MRLTQFFVLSLSLVGCTDRAPQNNFEHSLKLIKLWVHGNYNNVSQAEADMASDLPPEQMHRPMHQLFVPMDAPNIEGYIVYQQSAMDGSEAPAMIFRHGLMQYLPDPDSDALLQRELYFKDPEPYKNLHRNPELLNDVTLDDMTWDTGCDFYLRVNDSGDMVSGPLREGECVLFNQGTQQEMYADDRVEITATDYRFHGRYRDADGNIVWGTSSEVLNSMVRQ
ncbi:MAG: hypothetical protein HKN56_08950 [Gammaproteobacteria bacterium]|nr:hypothetical protein [Gammaproteobacteria bacterium]